MVWRLRQPPTEDGGTFWKGERIDYRYPERVGDAIKRHLANKQFATKPTPVADPRLAELRALNAEHTRLTNAVAAKAEAERLQGEVNRLSTEVARRDAPPKRGPFGLRVTGDRKTA